MSAKHTPGPWRFLRPIGVVVDADEQTVCRISAAVVDPFANARLIAAAPKLLDSARRAQCACSAAERDSGHRIGCWFPDLAAAIAEAEGR